MSFRCLAAFAFATLASPAFAAPGDTIYAEDFEDGDAGGWNGTGSFGVGAFPAASGEISLYTCCGNVDLLSPVIDTSVAGAQLSLRVQRGGTSIGSDLPEGRREYLDVYFLNDNGNWIHQARYPTGGTAGEVFNSVFTLDDPQFLHSNFRVRLFQDSGDANEDYWHLHEISIVEASASGGIGSLCDDFSNGLARWTVNDFGGAGAVAATTQAANSPTRGLAIFDGSVRIQSLPLDLADASGATLNLWVRRGDDSFSEAPDVGEDFVIGYIDVNGNAQQLHVLAGDDAPGETFNLSFPLPADALHDAFQVRIERYGNGAGGYWHIDDVCVDIQRTLDHFAIRHDGSGVNCQAEPVEIAAHDLNHFVVENYTGMVGLSTSTGNGDWSLLAGGGALANAGAGDGSYLFNAADNGDAVLGLRDTFAETVNVDARNGTTGEHAAEDGDVTFARSGFNVLVDGNATPVGVQIAGKPSNVAPNPALLELQAIRTDDSTGACAAAFTGSVNVDLAFSCEEPASCAGGNLAVNGSIIAANSAGTPVAFTTLALDFGDASDSTAPVVLQYDDAGRIRLHARHVLQPSAEVMAGSSNTFTVRPFGFDVSASGNPGAVDASGAVYRKAGEAFAVNVRAVGWQARDDADLDGIPDGYGNGDPADNADLSDNPPLANFGNENFPGTVSLSANLALPASGANPGLSGNTALTGFVNGTANATLRFSEAGIIELVAALADGDYLGAGNLRSRSGFVGRFIPDHFDVVIASHGCNDVAGFSYSGQPLRNVGVTARNGAGGTVSNFDGALGFAKTVFLGEVTGAPGTVLNGGISALDFIRGTATVTNTPAGVAFRFANPGTAPASITLRATGSDGVSSLNHAEGVTQVRSARFAVDDASAPVLANAVSFLRVETFDAGEWLPETQDTCTVFDAARLSLGAHAENLAAGESLVGGTNFASGAGQVTLTAPGVGNNGSMQLNYDTDPWLEYDWTGTGAEDPAGTIRFFEIFATEPGFIQRQEVVP
ncbi:MAG TPA: DUF6701 domain-containing protein [Gammaproteobacteria bacterium]